MEVADPEAQIITSSELSSEAPDALKGMLTQSKLNIEFEKKLTEKQKVYVDEEWDTLCKMLQKSKEEGYTGTILPSSFSNYLRLEEEPHLR